MRRLSYNLQSAIEQYSFTPVVLQADAVYEVGKTYWCGYWSQWYKVLDAKYATSGRCNELLYVTVAWQDGQIRTHCTRLRKNEDWELVWAKQTSGGVLT